MPDYVAVPYMGFPGELAGNRIVLRCELDGREMLVSSLRTNTQWATAFLRTAGFCPGPARLIALVSDPNHYIGVAKPFEITATAYTNSRKRRLFQLGRRAGTEHEIIV